MSTQHTYAEIADSYALWAEFVDADSAMTEEEFNAMPAMKKIQLQVDAFGPEIRGTTFSVTMGEITGEYQAESKNQALDLFAQDAGYSNWADAVAQGLASDEAVKVTEA